MHKTEVGIGIPIPEEENMHGKERKMIMKKKVLAVLTAAAMMIGLTACGGSGNSGLTVTVATSPDFAPYEFYAIGADGTPELAGFDMALAQYIADDMGLELEVVTMDFDGVLSEVQTKSVDIGMAGLSPDPTREDFFRYLLLWRSVSRDSKGECRYPEQF